MGHRKGQPRPSNEVFKSGALACAIGRLVLGAAFALPPLVSSVAHAQVDAQARGEQAHGYDIAGGSLEEALTRFGRESNVMLSFGTEVTAGLRSAGLHGSYTLRSGLDALLTGSGLHAVAQPNGSYVIQALPAPRSDDSTTLRPVTVTGQMESVADRVNPRTTLASKMALTQREIPQSVTVIPQQQIEEQSLRTLSDAVRFTPGLSIAQSDSERTNFYSRGFPIDTWLFDGIPSNQNLASIAPNLAMFDRVEILRGPDGLLNGFGSTGGAINLVRKRAPKSFHAAVELYGGTYDTLGGQLDAGGALNDEGSVRGRAVVAGESRDLAQDSTWRRDKSVYGTLEADPSPDTTLRIGGSYAKTEQKALWTGLPAYAGYRFLDVSRSTYIGADWNHNAYDIATGFAEAEHRLDNGWTTKLAFNYLKNRSSIRNGNVGGPVDPVTDEATIGSTKWKQNDEQQSVDAYASGPFELFGRTHQVTIGGSYQREELRVRNFYCSDINPFCQSTDVIAAAIAEPAFDGPVSDETTVIKQYGIYGSARFSLSDPLTLAVGGRATRWNSDFSPNPAANYWGDADRKIRIGTKFTPYAGLIYDLGDSYSLYTSYTSIFKPQSAYNRAGNLLEPLEGNQYEAGIKADYFAGRLNASLAGFRLTQKNRALDDPDFPNQGYSVAQGKARSKGIELTLTGELQQAWTVFGGYTYTDTEYLDSSTNQDGIGFSNIAPRHLLKLWTSYRLSGALERFSIGGGTYLSSGTSARDAGGKLEQSGYATVDLRLGYQINPQLSAAINASNMFDRKYYEYIGFTGGSVFYGNPRCVLLTLRYSLPE